MEIRRTHGWQVQRQRRVLFQRAHIDTFPRGIDQPVEIDDIAKRQRVQIGLVRRRAQADFTWPAGRSHSTVSVADRGEPVRIGAMLDPAVRMDPRHRAAGRQAEGAHRHLHAAGMAVADLDIAVDHHILADKPHRPHANGIAKLFQLVLKRGDPGIAIAVADRAKTGGTLAKNHAAVLCAAKADADDRRLAGQPALAEGHQAVEIEAFDALRCRRGEQHPVVGAEQAALMHGDRIDPFAPGS